MPDPLTGEKISEQISAGSQLVETQSAQRLGNLSLKTAIQLALDQNFDRMNQAYLSAVSRRDLDFGNNDMMASVLADLGWSKRNERDWSTSQTLRTGLIGPDYSSGNDSEQRRGSIGFSWNLLDFGLSYYSAKQKANSALIQAEIERRTTNNILLEVVRAWHRAKAFHTIQPRLLAAERAARETLIAAEKAGSTQVENPLQALTFQRELVDTLTKIDGLKREFEIAKQILNALLGRNPDAPISSFGADDVVMASATSSLEELIDVAPLLRSEVRSVMYEAQNEKYQDDARRLALLPLPRLAVDGNYSSNSFNLSRDWASLSLNLVGNLTKLALMPSAAKSAEEKEALAASKVRAIVLAVKLQTYIAHRDYVAARKTQELNDRFAAVSRQIVQQVRNARTADAASQRQQVREDVNLLWAEMRQATAAVEARSAKYRLLLTAGIDLYERGGATRSELQVADVLKGDRKWRERLLAPAATQVAVVKMPERSPPAARVASFKEAPAPVRVATPVVAAPEDASPGAFGRLRAMFSPASQGTAPADEKLVASAAFVAAPTAATMPRALTPSLQTPLARPLASALPPTQSVAPQVASSSSAQPLTRVVASVAAPEPQRVVQPALAMQAGTAVATTMVIENGQWVVRSAAVQANKGSNAGGR